MPAKVCPICSAVLPPGELGRHRRVVHGDIRGTRRWTKLRAQVIARDRGRCTVCGSPHALEVHHLNGDPSGNRLENLATLCRPCHRPSDRAPKDGDHRPRDDGKTMTAEAMRLL